MNSRSDVRATALDLHPLTLAFRGAWRHLEPAFLADYRSSSLPHFRIALTVGILFYAAFGYLDAALAPEQRDALWTIRYAVVCPSVLLGILLSWIPGFERYMQTCLVILMVIAGSGISVMVALTGPPAAYAYYAGVILVFMMSYGFIQARFLWATLAGWINVVFYEVVAVLIVQTPSATLLNNNFFFISANLIGMFVCYSIEYHTRRDYYHAYRLQEERRQVASLNEDLERRVRERTARLAKANRQLKREVEARKQAAEESRRLQEQLIRAQRMEALGTLAGGIAHDFNNILSSILGFAELSLEMKPRDPELQENLLEIRAAGRRAAALVHRILTFSRREYQELQPVPLTPIVHEVMAMLEATLPSTIELRSRTSEEAMVVQADTTRLHQAMLNLATNARQAMGGQPGRIEIVVTPVDLGEGGGKGQTPTGRCARIDVRDTGPGIPAEARKRIFEPYFTTRAKGEGTGLGLAIVHGVVQAHGGRIEVDSASGQGTTFSLFLPLVDKAPPAEDRRKLRRDSARTGHEHVLLVDDERAAAKVHGRTLERAGYRVSVKTRPEEALAALQADPDGYDLLLTDMTMPHMTGDRLAEQARQIRADLPVLLCTGYAESSEELRAAPFIDEVLSKPVESDRLRHAVRRLLDAHGAAREAPREE